MKCYYLLYMEDTKTSSATRVDLFQEKSEAQKVMDAAKVSIEQSRKEAEKSLRDEVSRYALAIAGQVTREQMKDAKAQQKLVDSLLDEMETNN